MSTDYVLAVLVAASVQGYGHIADAPAPARLKAIRVFEGHEKDVTSVAISPDGLHAVSGSYDKSVRCWDLKTGAMARRFAGHSDVVQCVAFAPDGRHVFSAGWDKVIRMWEFQTCKQVAAFTGHTGFIGCIAVSRDGAYLVSGAGTSSDEGCDVRAWNVKKTKQLVCFAKHEEPISGVAISPDGAHVLSGCSEQMWLWKLHTGETVRKFDGAKKVGCVALSPNGRKAVTGGDDNVVRLWDVGNGMQLRSMEGHKYVVWSVAFSPDGRLALSSSGAGKNAEAGELTDCTARLWQAETGKELCLLEGHTGAILGVAFLPDGKHVLTASSDKTLRLWKLPFP